MNWKPISELPANQLVWLYDVRNNVELGLVDDFGKMHLLDDNVYVSDGKIVASTYRSKWAKPTDFTHFQELPELPKTQQP